MGATIAQNRRARHEFHVEDTFEAGIVLRGTEIKSIRAHKVSLADAYARIEEAEAWIIGLHIAPSESTDVRFNHERSGRECCSTARRSTSSWARRGRRA
jgi:SsrA-binding protein